MRKIILVLTVAFLPVLVSASTASDFIVNSQSAYAIPPGSTKVLILDLTLPEVLKSIKIKNSGTAQQIGISRISVFEDGQSLGWDGDEEEIIIKSSSPFWDTWLSGAFSRKRIFITVNIASAAASGKTIKPQLQIDSVKFVSGDLGPTDTDVFGLERMISAGTSLPTAPVAPLAGTPEVLSALTIRWHFTDLSNNEFGFKILDANLKEVARKEQADLSYLDETGLTPDTEYASRKVIAFNDRGESLSSSLSVFPAVRTLPLPKVEEPPVVPIEEITEVEPASAETAASKGGLFSPDELRAQIQEVQLKIIDLLKQLIQLLQEQISAAQASLLMAFESVTNWLQTRF